MQHQYLDDGLAPGNNTASDTSTIGVTVADDDAQSGSDTDDGRWSTNVAPTVALNAVPDVNENGTATLTGSYTDIGLLDGHTLTVDWDDPNNAADSTFAIPAIRNAAGMATLSVGDTFNSSTDVAVLTITCDQRGDRPGQLQRPAPIPRRRPRARQQHGQRHEHDRRDGRR